jgi:heterodisulfide reductase subunit A
MSGSGQNMNEPRIGVFVCHCGSNIAGVVDVEKVTENAKGLPYVVYAEHNMYTCSEDGLQSIKKAIKEHNIDRVIVASCTPRTHGPLFQATCEDAGVNKYLFDLVNIRDQCSWVHMKEKEKATEKSKRLIRMGVARVALLEPQEETEMEVLPVGLVIGGGISGMKAALNLANQGLDVHLVERENELGGMLTNIDILIPSNKKASDVIEPIINKVRENDRVTVHINSTIEDINGYIGNFKVKINESEINVGTVIIATGSEVFQPEGLFGYGEHKNIVTQLELEDMFRKEVPIPDRVTFIQCVGARNQDRQYCSRICCMTAIKNAYKIKQANPSSTVTILYRDIMSPGKDNELLYKDAMESGVKFMLFDGDHPPEIVTTGNGHEVSVSSPSLDNAVTFGTDLIVLSTPLISREDNSTLSKMLKVPLDKDGFFLEAHVKLRPLDFATDGVYLCGSARFPCYVDEAVSQAYGAAAKAAIPMRKGFIKGAAIYAEVDPTSCVGCGMCERMCEYGAPSLEMNEDGLWVSKINQILCKGCGVCAVTCPSRAISMHHYKDEQIASQIDALLKEVTL